MGINHNRRVLFWWSKLFAADERRVSFGPASQLYCQILPRCRSTRESGFSSMTSIDSAHAGELYSTAELSTREHHR